MFKPQVAAGVMPVTEVGVFLYKKRKLSNLCCKVIFCEKKNMLSTVDGRSRCECKSKGYLYKCFPRAENDLVFPTGQAQDIINRVTGSSTCIIVHRKFKSQNSNGRLMLTFYIYWIFPGKLKGYKTFQPIKTIGFFT